MVSKKFRRRISYLPTIASISLVLFLLGLFAAFIYNANTLKQSAQENIEINIYFKDDVKQDDIIALQKRLERERFVKQANFISKEEGLSKWQKDMGEDPEVLLGFNPIPNSLDVHFKAGFVQKDSMKWFKRTLEGNPLIREVSYNEPVVENLDNNIKLVGVILLGLAALMGIVSIALIYNTIRLTLYAKRFIIKSMQLVGATQNFIRKPFIFKGFLLGMVSSILACVLLVGTLYFLTVYFPDLKYLENLTELGILLAGIIILGIFISAVSSYFAVNKYIKMKLDDLF